MNTLGTHLLIELWSCDSDKLDKLGYLEEIMCRAARSAGATVLKAVFQDFNPQGVSGVVVIAESHLTIHTWPEHSYAAVDVFTCGTTVDPWQAAEFLREELGAGRIKIRDFRRGIPPSDEMPTDETELQINVARRNTHGQ